MAWVALSKEEKERVQAQLPDILTLHTKSKELIPDLIAVSTTGNTGSTIPQAASCLHDATRFLMQIDHALRELLSFRIWYLERKDPPSKDNADHMALFYADDVALRLYSVVEHLGNALNLMLEMGLGDRIYHVREKAKDYLDTHRSGDPITTAWSRLLEDPDWIAVLEYRNDWIHNKPPIVKKWGIEFNREPRWVKDPEKGTQTLIIGEKGDPPDWESVDQLVEVITSAVSIVLETTEAVIDFYMELISVM